MSTFSAELEFAKELAKEAGEIARKDFRKAKLLPPKDGGEILTETDVKLNRLIVEKITQRYPADSILSEEENDHLGSSERMWFIDPIDGTANFARGIPWFAISIALKGEQAMRVGAVYDPIHDDLYFAERGKGAFRNDEKLKTADPRGLENAYVVLDYTEPKEIIDIAKVIAALLPKAYTLHMTWSGILNSCQVAAGKWDVFFANNPKPYDSAAVSLIVEEAGGVATDLFGQKLPHPDFSKGFIVTANSLVHRELIEIINQTKVE